MYSVLFLDRKTRQVIRRFDYPVAKILNKFFWEKLKATELQKLTRSRLVEPEDIIVKDISSVNDIKQDKLS